MSIKKIVREFLDPRFSTQEIENSRLRSNLNFDLVDFYYNDEKEGYPTHVSGTIKTGHGIIIQANWDQHGECTVKGKRIRSFYLIRETRSEIDSSRTIGTVTLVGLLALLIRAIF